MPKNGKKQNARSVASRKNSSVSNKGKGQKQSLPKSSRSTARGRDSGGISQATVRKYVEFLTNPWSDPTIRLPRINPMTVENGVSWQNLYTIFADNTNLVSYGIANCAYDTAGGFGNATLPSLTPTFAAAIPGSVFPATIMVASAAPKSCAIRVTPTGNYANANGYVAVGTLKPNQTLPSWNVLTNQPDVSIYPMSALIGRSLVVYGRKYSTSSDDFIASNISPDDFSIPFVYVYAPGAAKTADQLLGCQISMDILSTYDIISTMASTNPLLEPPKVDNPLLYQSLNAAQAVISQVMRPVKVFSSAVFSGMQPVAKDHESMKAWLRGDSTDGTTAESGTIRRSVSFWNGKK